MSLHSGWGIEYIFRNESGENLNSMADAAGSIRNWLRVFFLSAME